MGACTVTVSPFVEAAIEPPLVETTASDASPKTSNAPMAQIAVTSDLAMLRLGSSAPLVRCMLILVTPLQGGIRRQTHHIHI